MANPFSNIKKVRGWKRRIRQAEQWRRFEGELDLDHLRQFGSTYAEISFAPWRRREPPFWYRRILLQHLIDIYHDWEQQLPREFGNAFYLRLWLFHPKFHSSQVVAAVGESVEDYQHRFPQALGLRTTPLPEYQGPGYNLSDFEWRPCIDEDHYSVVEDELDADQIAWMEKHAARREQSSTGDPVYVLHRGFLWVGARRPG